MRVMARTPAAAVRGIRRSFLKSSKIVIVPNERVLQLLLQQNLVLLWQNNLVLLWLQLLFLLLLQQLQFISVYHRSKIERRPDNGGRRRQLWLLNTSGR